MTDESSKDSPPTKTKQNSTSFVSRLLIGITFIASITAIVIAVLAWEQLSTIHSNTNAAVSQQQNKVSEIGQTLDKVQTSISENQKNISQLIAQASNTTTQQGIAEATYLIRLAHVHLMIDDNITLALQLLKIAEQRLQTITSVTATHLKSSISEDISALSAVPKVDLPNIITQLNQISEEVNQLPVQHKSSPKPTTSNTVTTTSEHWWDKTKHNLSGLKNLFIIRHIDSEKIPLISPQQIIFLKENVRLKLSEAEWATLHQQPTIYQESLTMAAKWLNEYGQNQPAIKPIVKKIQALALINIKPQIPALKSLKTLSSLSSLKAPTSEKTKP